MGAGAERGWAWRTVVILTAVGVAVATGISVALGFAVLALVHELLTDEFLFLVGVVLAVPLVPMAAAPLLCSGYLGVRFVGMLRDGPGGRIGPRLVLMLTAGGLSGVMAGVGLRAAGGPWQPILLGGVLLTACGGGALWVAAAGRRDTALADAFVPVRPADPAADRRSDDSFWTYRVDLTRGKR